MKLAVVTVAALLATSPAFAADEPIALVIKDHKFAPAEIHVKANMVNVIAVNNQDPTAEEFDSSALKVEKVVAGNSQGTVRLRPLAPGRYPFMGEFHAGTAQGVVVAE